ncbi:TIGR03936 family radical SAM-associated protein [Geothrix sp. 21YS21S-4]|uniref:TIGR03936 family radical SAM-associated protein n=1 Tax=Geothrix sp. 21YS21S-4 TaxID=3068889 RepID=UPI0027BA619C|nr:TIGR03936 family radical SAM-associated protein [Geothrix sp. 21YS21S-4]
MDECAPHSVFIPAEALARQARLAAALAAMAARGASREPAPLQTLRRILAGEGEDLAACVAALAAAELAEDGLDLAKAGRRDGGDAAAVKAAVAALESPAAKAQARREAHWQLDGRRTSIRLAYAKEAPALDFDDGDLQALFLRALRLEGFSLALDLGKRPRPLLRVELPLPAGAGGRCEWIELVLRVDPPGSAQSFTARLNARLPEGLRVHGWEPHPAYASPLGELAEAFHWSWVCPPERMEAVRSRTEAFLAAPVWLWEKGGKVDGRKQAKQVDLRPLMIGLRWEGNVLLTTTRAAEADAANPLKWHAAILGLEPETLWGLVRVSTDLKPDPRLARAERFEPKLKNMYEDAVLLAGGSNITLVDEDDDEPIRLG